MNRVRFSRSFSVAASIAAVACGPPHGTAPSPSAAVSTDPCTVVDSLGLSRDTVRVALLEPVDAGHAPTPTNDAERLVFRQLYEPLVRVDCAGVVRPGLASRWRSEGDTAWTFDLRAGTQFWDGAPVDAAAVVAAWRDPRDATVRGVRAAGERTVVVSLTAPRSIEAFGDAAWNVVKRIPESPWPLGTTDVWVRDWEQDGTDTVLRAAPLPHARLTMPVLLFRAAPGADPRDLMDATADVLITRDAGVLRYAAGRPPWHDIPLAWDRLYALLSATRQVLGATTQLDADTRAALAHDAVRDEARPVPFPSGAEGWWTESGCAAHTVGPDRIHAEDIAGARVAFPRDDPVARDLAGRLVARADAELATLVGGDPGIRPRAVPLDAERYRDQLVAGVGLAFIARLPSRPLDPCRAVASLAASAPWLTQAPGSLSASAVVPLVETRGYLLVRDVPVVRLDWDGGVRLLGGSRP